MTTEICKHCNGWRGLHKWDTMQCPYMGMENENWQATTYEEADETAAATIAAQAARIAELEAALEPFVNAAKVIHPAIDDRDGLWTASSNGVHTKITAGDCRRARALLETK